MYPVKSSYDLIPRQQSSRSEMSRLKTAWISLALVFVLHVSDEASHDFLRFYNPNVRIIRQSLGIPFPPELSYPQFIGGMMALVILCAFLTPLLDRGRRWTLIVARIWAMVQIANGLQHIVTSIAVGRMMPGVLTSPLLLLIAPWLLLETLRVNRRAPAPSAD